MAHFLEVLFIGLMLSSTYILVAVGFTLFFGAIDIVQFDHGDVAMLGAFVATRFAVKWGPKAVRYILLIVLAFASLKLLGVFDWLLSMI